MTCCNAARGYEFLQDYIADEEAGETTADAGE
jgi:hypothetical protein